MRIFRIVAMAIIAMCCVRYPADAHPLGNFTSNHLTRIGIDSSVVALHYVLDDAEIPTFALVRAIDPHGTPTHAELDAWARQHAREIASQLLLTQDGKPAALTLVATRAYLKPGAAGLSTLYFTADYRAPRTAGAQHIEYNDTTLPGRIGWKDVVVLPQREPTGELQRYPNALIGSPRDRTDVAITIAPDGAVRVADAGAPPMFGLTSTAKMNDLSDVLARNLADPLVLLGALLLAVGLGALHALEPGHGKTLLAISLVGARATVSQAFILATALTLAHTVGVLAFGVVVLTLARYIVPEALYPWIALLSGIFVAVLGARALARELKRRRSAVVAVPAGDRAAVHAAAAARAFAQMSDHDHGSMTDEEHARAHMIPGTAPISFRGALIAATTGNVAPCPAALVVLLAAIATHRIGWGLVLIVAFSVGLALTLTLLGVAVVRSAAWLTKRPQFDRLARHAPLVTAATISVIGAVMIGEGAVAQGIVTTPFAVVLIVLATIVAFIALETRRRAPHPRSVPA